MQKRTMVWRIVVSVAVVAAAFWYLIPMSVRLATSSAYDLGTDSDTNRSRRLGYVNQGRFLPLMSDHALSLPVDLTGIHMVQARSPESEQVDLSDQEGHLLIVSGFFDSGWVYQAHIDRDLGRGAWAQIIIWAWSR